MDILALFLLLYVFLWNLRTVSERFKMVLPSQLNWIGVILRLDQSWDMFSKPKREDGWYIIPGKLSDGTEIDIFSDRTPVLWQKPNLVSATFPSDRWNKYIMNLWYKRHAAHRRYFSDFICRRWNSRYPEEQKLEFLQIVFIKEETLPDYQQPKLEKILLWNHRCDYVRDREPARP